MEHARLRLSVLLVGLLLVSASTPALAAAGSDSALSTPERAGLAATDAANAASTTATSDVIHLRTEVALTPAEPGEVRVRLTFSAPERVTSLRVALPEETSVVGADGFDAEDGEWTWDGDTESPTLRYDLRANRTGQMAGPEGADGSYLFVDAGDWALVREPSVDVRWVRRGGDPVTFERSFDVAGEGAAGQTIAYLGPVDVYERTAHGQTFRLAVPERSTLAEPREEIFASLVDASDRLRVGERDDEVFVVAAPTDQVDWAASGLTVGGADFYVRDEEPLDDPSNTWLHEYVHTRQDFNATRTGKWVTEASATWYAAHLSLEQGRITFSQFGRYLSTGNDGATGDAVLAAPDTWVAGANYLKGSLVLGELDRRIRLATDQGATLQAVFRRLNADSDGVTNGDVLLAVAAASTDRTAAVAERYTESRAAPEMWSAESHEAAFGPTPARMAVSLASLRVSGPYGNRTVESPVTVATGESVRLRVDVRNAGGTTGAYRLPVRVDGAVVAERTGSLAPDESATVAYARAFDEPGTHTVAVGTESVTVRVREPADPVVTDFSANRTLVEGSGDVAVTVSFTNPSSAPTDGALVLRVDGETVAERTVRVPPGASGEATFVVGFDAPGTHRVSVGDRRLSVLVREETAARTARSPAESGAGDGSGVETPGFGAVPAVVALCVVVLGASARARRER